MVKIKSLSLPEIVRRLDQRKLGLGTELRTVGSISGGTLTGVVRYGNRHWKLELSNAYDSISTGWIEVRANKKYTQGSVAPRGFKVIPKYTGDGK